MEKVFSRFWLLGSFLIFLLYILARKNFEKEILDPLFFFVGHQSFTLTAIGLLKKTFCLFDFLVVAMLLLKNGSDLSRFLVNFDCFSLLLFDLSLSSLYH